MRFSKILPILGFAAAATIYFSLNAPRNDYVGLNVSPISQPEKISLSLSNPNGRKWSSSDFTGKWTILFFGYVSCPDVCPTSMASIRREYEQLSKWKDQVEVVFVSVDPKRDSQPTLQRYAEFFHKDFHGITGTASEIKSLTKQLGAFYQVEKTDPKSKEYLVSHNYDFFIIDPDGRWFSVYRPPFKKGFIAEDLAKILQQESTKWSS